MSSIRKRNLFKTQQPVLFTTNAAHPSLPLPKFPSHKNQLSELPSKRAVIPSMCENAFDNGIFTSGRTKIDSKTFHHFLSFYIYRERETTNTDTSSFQLTNFS